jgi:hypothetical protein
MPIDRKGTITDALVSVYKTEGSSIGCRIGSKEHASLDHGSLYLPLPGPKTMQADEISCILHCQIVYLQYDQVTSTDSRRSVGAITYPNALHVQGQPVAV